MKTFSRLLGSLLLFVYPNLGRIVIQGYLPLLTRPEHVVDFIHDMQDLYPIIQRFWPRMPTTTIWGMKLPRAISASGPVDRKRSVGAQVKT